MSAVIVDPAVVLKLLATAMAEGLEGERLSFVFPGEPEPEPSDTVRACVRMASIVCEPLARQRDDASAQILSGRASLDLWVSGEAVRDDRYAVATACGLVVRLLEGQAYRDATTGTVLQLESLNWTLGLDASDETGLMAAAITAPFQAHRNSGTGIEDHLSPT